MTSRRELFEKTNTEEDAFYYAQEIGLVSISRKSCPNQGCAGFLNFEKGKTRHKINGRYKCNKRLCRQTVSVF